VEKIMIKKTTSLVLSLTTLSFLVGCAAYEESFDCPAGKGIGCQSVTEVKKKLNQGAIEIPETTTEAAARLGGRGVPYLAPQVSTGQGNGNFKTTSSEGSADPLVFVDSNGLMIERAREKPLRVWVAPYQDQDGNFHEASVVHTVIRPGYWQIQTNATA
jgi:conjugal transfer pilus assembly protein TraV